jgi:hypothetical protein
MGPTNFGLHQVDIVALGFLIQDYITVVRQLCTSVACSCLMEYHMITYYPPHAVTKCASGSGQVQNASEPRQKKIKIITKMRYAIIIRSGKLTLGSVCCRNTSLTVRTLEQLKQN